MNNIQKKSESLNAKKSKALTNYNILINEYNALETLRGISNNTFHKLIKSFVVDESQIAKNLELCNDSAEEIKANLSKKDMNKQTNIDYINAFLKSINSEIQFDCLCNHLVKTYRVEPKNQNTNPSNNLETKGGIASD